MNKKFNLDLFGKNDHLEEKYCEKCKTKNNSNAKFCCECGNNTFISNLELDRYCTNCNIKLDSTDECCPICGGDVFVSSIDELVDRYSKKHHKLLIEATKDSTDELANITKLVTKNEKIYREKDSLRQEKQNKVDKLNIKYNNFKKERESYILSLNKEIKALESSFEETNKKYFDVLKELETAKNDLKEFEDLYDISKLQFAESLEKYNNLLALKEETNKKLNDLKIKNKKVGQNLPIEYLEIESAFLSSLVDLYIKKDRRRALRYLYETQENENTLENIIFIVNDFTLYFYEEKNKSEWNNFAYDIFHKNEGNLSNRERVAYAMILADPNTKHYNKEKALEVICNISSSYYIDIYNIGLTYLLLGEKEKAIKLLEDTYNKMTDNGYNSLNSNDTILIKGLLDLAKK